MYRAEDSRRDAELRARLLGRPVVKQLQLKNEPRQSIKSADKPSPEECPDKAQIPCKHIRQAATRGHSGCVEHFWKERQEGNLEEQLIEKQAMLAALMKKDVSILEYLKKEKCPWDPHMADGFLCSLQNRPGEEWREFHSIAFKFGLASYLAKHDLLLAALKKHDWELLEQAHNQKESFKGVPTAFLVTQPGGSDVAALEVLSTHPAFKTFRLDWLTPLFAVRRNDEALLKFALKSRPTPITSEVTEAAAEFNNPKILKLLQEFPASNILHQHAVAESVAHQEHEHEYALADTCIANTSGY